MPQAPDWLSHWWYLELKGWQSGIAALLGFIALVVGALINFSLNRRRDKALGRDEAQAVAAALYGEILSVRERLALLAKVLSTQASRVV
jgi:membrane-bound ClpP family serine protease